MLERRMAETFVELADTLVVGFDVIDLLHTLTERCVELLDVDAAGILLADQRGTLKLVAASTEQARLLELFQLQDEEGPCLDCHRTGSLVDCPDLSAMPQRWPRFTVVARAQGFAAVIAVPMRLRDEVVGAMNLFRFEPGDLPPGSARMAQALADIATISILHERALTQRGVLVEQLQSALNSRIVIEQAKGILAERGQITVEAAFLHMRAHARANNRGLSEIARAIADRTLDIEDLLPPRAPVAE
ncbi:GAF and ANTAR domain-containing protein [Nonomuraea dietziae]|uniref:GAF and ANTAR domain-containing protein n=2 Tax=Nonomuraea dietziae TaxID=65515 RepID=UPI0033C78B5A